MAKKKIELFVNVYSEKEFENILSHNTDRLICAEIFSNVFGSCTALDRVFTMIKLVYSEGKMILLKVPADEIKSLSRFREHSEPVYMFILNKKVIQVFRGVDAIRLTEVAKKEIHYWNTGFPEDRQLYELDEPTPGEIEWMEKQSLEKKEAETMVLSRQQGRQAARKKHRAELMVPHLKDLNFVVFFPHCKHAHPELYERWDMNNIIMVGREEFQITEDNLADIFYEGDAPLNEASMQNMMMDTSLAICFRVLDDVDFVALTRRILYQEIPKYDETKSLQDQKPLMTAFDFYKTLSPTREEVWKQRKEERKRSKEEKKFKRQRMKSEMKRLAAEELREIIEAKRMAKEQRKLELLKAGDLVALERLKQEPEEEPEMTIPEELSTFEEEEEEEEEYEEDENEYFPPPGLLIPGFYAPPNDIAKANGLAVLFPKIVAERVIPRPEFLPPHILVLLDIARRYKILEAIRPYRNAILKMGIFKALSPYKCEHIAYSFKQFDTLDTTSMNLEDIKLAFMISVEVDTPLLHLMDFNPFHVSRDIVAGEDECAAMFPVRYGDEYDQFEDFHATRYL